MTLLLREAIGDSFRRTRTSQSRTLREVSSTARVSLGYLSEVERGRKEASSELLAAICDALEVPLSDVLFDVSESLSGGPGFGGALKSGVAETPSAQTRGAGSRDPRTQSTGTDAASVGRPDDSAFAAPDGGADAEEPAASANRTGTGLSSSPRMVIPQSQVEALVAA